MVTRSVTMAGRMRTATFELVEAFLSAAACSKVGVVAIGFMVFRRGVLRQQ